MTDNGDCRWVCSACGQRFVSKGTWHYFYTMGGTRLICGGRLDLAPECGAAEGSADKEST
jgi:hypothetical protein